MKNHLRHRPKRYETLIASSARPLSTVLALRTGEPYSHPWHMKRSKFHPDKFSLYRGAIKKFEVRFIDEVSTPASVRRQIAKVVKSHKQGFRQRDLRQYIENPDGSKRRA